MFKLKFKITPLEIFLFALFIAAFEPSFDYREFVTSIEKATDNFIQFQYQNASSQSEKYSINKRPKCLITQEYIFEDKRISKSTGQKTLCFYRTPFDKISLERGLIASLNYVNLYNCHDFQRATQTSFNQEIDKILEIRFRDNS